MKRVKPNKRLKVEWTNPYFGVSHVTNLHGGKQISMNVLGNGMAEVYMVDRQSDTPFTKIKEAYGKPEAMKRRGNKWAREILS